MDELFPGLFVGVIVVVVLGVIGFLVWAASMEKPRGDPRSGHLVLRHGLVMRGFVWLIALGVPIGIGVLAYFHPPKNQSEVYAILGCLALFGTISLLLMWMVYRFRLRVTEEGLECRPEWKPGRFVPWAEVESVTSVGLNVVTKTRDGWSFTVQRLIPGVSLLLERCSEMLPDSAVSHRTVKQQPPKATRRRRRDDEDEDY